jgi:hypothetical protein
MMYLFKDNSLYYAVYYLSFVFEKINPQTTWPYVLLQCRISTLYKIYTA